jgi:hypothetical protein
MPLHSLQNTPRNPNNPCSFNAGSADNPAGLIAYVADATSGATLLTTTECWTHSVTSVPGTTAAKPAAKASDIYDYSASDGKPASGAYYYQPSGMSSPQLLFTDFNTDGGGWVVISKWGAYSKTVDKLFNANAYDTAGGGSLTSAAFAGYSTYARLSRTFMNAMWASCSRYVVRVHFKNDAASASSGVFFQQKVCVSCVRVWRCACCACLMCAHLFFGKRAASLSGGRRRAFAVPPSNTFAAPPKVSNAASFDVWKGHYSPLYWSDQQTANSEWTTSAGGTLYKVSRGRATTDPSYATYVTAGSVGASIFNPASDQIVGGEGENAIMGFWDRTATVDAPNFGTLGIGELVAWW